MTIASAAFAIPGDPDQRTGGYIYARRLAAGLEARGWRVEFLRLPDGFPDPSPDELVHTANLLAAQQDGATVLIDGLAFGAMDEIAASERSRLRLVALVHHPLAFEEGLPAPLRDRLRESERRALAHAGAVLATSAHTRDVLRHEFAVPAAKLHIAVPGVDRQPPATGSASDVTAILAVGSIIQRKGFDRLIQALARSSALPWRLTIAGSLDRDERAVRQLRAAIVGCGLADRVLLAGDLPHRQLEELWATSDLFVSSSSYEGFGMAVAEALAHALPVVAVAGGALGDWVDRRAAMLTPPGDETALAHALAEVLASPERRAQLAAAARATELPSWSDAAAAAERALLA